MDGLSAAHGPATSHMEAGRVIAEKYRLVREIGRGGMGSVWEAVHETLGRTLAVKFLTAEHEDPTLADRFVSEARMVASIKHRFVVDVFDFGITPDGLYYMVLELLEGSPLSTHMDTGPALSVRDGVRLVADCLKGLDAVHVAGIVHRDLKPENIFLVHDSDGVFPKLIDFGISRRDEAPASEAVQAEGRRPSRLTVPGMLIGTPGYMSPEQLRGRSDIDRRSDVYGMGVILYELLAGHLPFADDNVADLMVAIVTRKAPTLVELRPELGKALSDAVARALEPAVEARFPSAPAFREALLAALPSLPDGAQTVLQKQDPSAAAGAYGKRTELLLQKAQSPFEEGRGPRLPGDAKARTQLVIALVIAALSVGLFVAWRSTRPGSSTAAPETAAPAAAHLPAAALAPSTASAPTTPPPSAAEPAVAAPVPDMAPATKVAEPARAPSAAVHAAPRPKVAPTPDSRQTARPQVGPKRPAKALFKKLDF